MFEIDEQIAYENMVFEDVLLNVVINETRIKWISDIIINAISLKPFRLEYFVQLCRDFCISKEFKDYFLPFAAQFKPVIVHRLFEFGVYNINDVIEQLNSFQNYFLALYFIPFIPNLEQLTESYVIPCLAHYPGLPELPELVQYGFARSSIEYYMKYDDIDNFVVLYSHSRFNSSATTTWSLFEWANRPKSDDFLSFSAHFGSIKVFKFLLMQGFQIDYITAQHSVKGGSLEILRLCFDYIQDSSIFMLTATECNNLEILSFLLENGAKLDFCDTRFKLLYIATLHLYAHQ